MLHILNLTQVFTSGAMTKSPSYATAFVPYLGIVDLTACISPPTYELDPRLWHRIEKDLYLYILK